MGGTSLKAALDLDWDDALARGQALAQVLAALRAVEAWLDETGMPCDARGQTLVAASLAAAHTVLDQDVELVGTDAPRLRRGVARARRISIEDGAMRHGRKSRQQRIDGYKRHVLRDLESELVRAVGITAANVPEAQVTDALAADLARQAVTLSELHIDRAYLSSRLVRERAPELRIYWKAWPVRNGDRFPKTAFQLDWAQGLIRCPNDVVAPFQAGRVVRFPPAACAGCPVRVRCTSSASGRSVSIHPDEHLLAELRQRQTTPAGRAALRQRVAVEHSLAHVGHWQGRRARYVGVRKNLFDLRRTAVVHNLHVIARTPLLLAA